ncbi:unnamed protein product [Coffea canephora]|uniref:DH200=94 genomic scaffold, scaffold_6772 n=1 Tax=Coffea canephora TaxID=49390 RepID=A0A068VPZ6_COFCA|nr:unnamed protein product [Coffea canephora]
MATTIVRDIGTENRNTGQKNFMLLLPSSLQPFVLKVSTPFLSLIFSPTSIKETR